MTAVLPYILRVDMTDWAGNAAYALYSNFSLGAAETNYTIVSLGVYSGNAGMRAAYIYLSNGCPRCIATVSLWKGPSS